MIVFSLSAVSADDLQTTDSGQVSGDVDVATVSPWNTSGELTYDIPADVKDIKSADVYVNVYAGSAKNTHGADAHVSLKTVNSEIQIASEELWIENATSDGTVYPVNDHTDKCYSDYQMRYDITDSLKGLNGSSIAIKVDTFKMDGKEFDGRIKLIALVLAYDDGDDDIVSYWVDSTQKWTKTNMTTTFDTANLKGIAKADLTNVALSSANGNFTLNGEDLGAPANYSNGSYYQYSYWDVSDKIKEGSDTELLSINAGTGTYASLKNVLTVLKVQSDIVADVSLNTEYTKVPTCYAGTNNTLTIKANANKAGKYVIKLFADGSVVNSTEVELDGENEATLLLTDPTIRPIDETTVNGANNTEVTYAAEIYFGDLFLGIDNKTVPVLYNGNLGYDYEYNMTGFEQYSYVIDGDIVVDVQDVSTYLGASAMNRTDVWTVNLTGDSYLKEAIVLVPYNWFNANSYNETEGMFNVTFNGVTVEPRLFYRDQSNLGNYGNYGYGVLLYKVGDLLNTTGENTLVLNKNYPTPAVYPSTLLYWYNTPGGTFKEVMFATGADLLSNASNNAGRTVKSDSTIWLLGTDYVNATLYVLAASAQAGEGNIIINGVEFADVWNGTSSTTDLFTADITDIIAEYNNISFVATGSTILDLPQIIVADTGIYLDVDDIKTEYTSVPTIYAGTNNTLTVTVSTNINGEFVLDLYDGDVLVSSENVTLTNGTTTLFITDPTIRPIDETTVNGANNTEVTYWVELSYGLYSYDETITVPVLYNGNLGYDYEYNMTGFEEFGHYEITGDVVVDVQDVSTYLGASIMNRTDVWTVNLDEGSELEDAYLIIPYNWFNAKKYNETKGMFDLTFNNQTIVPVAYYRDQGNLGNYGKYGYGALIYRVDNLINISGENTLVLNKVDPTPAVYPSALVYLYDTPGGSIKDVSIIAGADLLSNDYNNARRIAKVDTTIDVDVTQFVNATLYVLAASAQAGEGNIIVNGVELENVWNGTSSTTDLFTADITDALVESNNISFVATGSTILALPQIIVADTGMVLSIDSIKTEYTSVPTAYAGTNNTLTVTLTNSMDGEFEIYLFDGFSFVAELKVNLTNGTHEIQITDPTIRPVDETTVNGADNKNVTYTVAVFYNDYPVYDNITVPVLYNGNLGKDMEYNATYIEDYEVYAVSGGVEVQTQDVSTYMSAGTLNRTDIFTIELDNASSLEKAFLYLAYNWDKSGVAGPVFNVTFNGNAITPKSTYRDQSNLGKYGAYGYGMFIYDVTEFAQAGNNTLFISKENGLTAVYPSNLIYLYNTEGSKVLTTVYMANGADLLSNANNNAGRIVKTDAIIPDVTLDVVDASLYVFAASAQPGEGSIVFNGNADVDVWKGTSNTFDTYVTDIIKNMEILNDVEFVATGSTILALNQMIVTKSIIKELPIVNIDVPSEINVGDNVTVTVTIPEATGVVYVMADMEAYDFTLSQGSVSFVINNITEGNHGVVVFYPGNELLLPGVGIKLFEVEEPIIPIETEFANIVIKDDLNISVVLKDVLGNPVANAVIAYSVNGTENVTITGSDGSFVIAGETGVPIDILYAGNLTYLGTHTSITFNVPVVPVVVKVESAFNITDRAITINGYAVDTDAGEEGIYYATELLDANGNPISNVYIEFAVNNKIYNRTTYDNGSFKPYKLNMKTAGRYTMAFNFAGDDNYTNAFACVCVDLDKKPIKIKASNKSYKASTKTKKYTVTLSTIVGSSHDGKVHLKSGMQVSLKVNGKTYTGKTNSKGQVTFKITNLSKKAKYVAQITYDGDRTYEAQNKTVKLTIK